jgi:PAS domain S-box-containing protein
MKRLNIARIKVLNGSLESQDIVEAIYFSFVVVDFEPTGFILNANQNFTDLMGYTLAELTGKHHGVLVDPEVRLSDEYSQFWERLSNGAEVKGKFKWITKYGEPIWINGGYTRVFDNANRVVKIVKIAFDITESVKKEMQLLDEITQLKKMVNFERREVDRVVNRIRDRNESLQHTKMGYSKGNDGIQEATSFVPDEKNSTLALPSSDGLTFVKIAEIIYCEADSNYTIFFLMDGRKIMVSQTLKEYEQSLAVYRFFRIHHSYLVNISMIKQYIRGEGGHVTMINGAMLDVSKRRKEEFLNLFSSKSSFV